MKSYSQNNEQEIILNYFNGKKGALLDIGANDGVTFSNSMGLIESGWRGVLLEPSVKAFELLEKNMEPYQERVKCYNFGISKTTGEHEFWESGSYKNQGSDVSLLSCIDPEEKKRWGTDVEFVPTKAQFYTIADFLPVVTGPYFGPLFNMVNIDAEGCDYDILQMMEYIPMGAECICIEHNGKKDLIAGYVELCKRMGLKEIGRNAENLIFAR